MSLTQKIFILAIASAFFFACKEKYTPKPREFFRIDFPAKSYHAIPDSFPYRFDIPDYARVIPYSDNPVHAYWINISVPANKAEIHLSYYQLANQKIPGRQLLNKFMEESHTFAYKHTIKADAIQEQVFMNPDRKVYGLIYRIEGNAASPMQFFLTDSVNHFLRGALYISEVPNIDSIKPVIDFLEPDIIWLIETTSWN